MSQPTSWKFFLKYALLGTPFGLTFSDAVGYIARVEGHSMQPLFNPDPANRKSDFVWLNNWPIFTNNYGQIERGEVIALVSPRDPKQRLIKRVVALGGDIVETKGYYKQQLEVPPGHCWVEGDNHSNSLDSNTFGPVSLGLVRSKAACILWPFDRAGFLQKQVEPGRVVSYGNSYSSSKETPDSKLKIPKTSVLTEGKGFTS